MNILTVFILHIIEVINPGESEEEDRFDFDSACYFNIGTTNANGSSSIF